MRPKILVSEPASPAPVLQLTASVAGRQDMRLHDGRVYLMLGCTWNARPTPTGT